MPSDPDHVLNAIDGVVDDWEGLSADSMRWAPPPVEKPSTLQDDLFREASEIFGPLVNTMTEIFRPFSGMLERALDLLEEPSDDSPSLDVSPDTDSCQCLCFRHEDQPGVCTGIATGFTDGIPMCSACMTA